VSWETWVRMQQLLGRRSVPLLVLPLIVLREHINHEPEEAS